MLSPALHIKRIPEYHIPVCDSDGDHIDYNLTPGFSIRIPSRFWKMKPDFKTIGSILDNILKTNYLNRHIAIRGLSSKEHPDMNKTILINTIFQLGHDRYDPLRKGDRYENIESKHIDFFALDFSVNESGRYFEHLIEPFYFWSIVDRGYPLKVDTVIIYDINKISVVNHSYKGRENEIKKDGFIFKDPSNKPDALLGVIDIS